MHITISFISAHDHMTWFDLWSYAVPCPSRALVKIMCFILISSDVLSADYAAPLLENGLGYASFSFVFWIV